jgi:hypothetical protein
MADDEVTSEPETPVVDDQRRDPGPAKADPEANSVDAAAAKDGRLEPKPHVRE